MGEFLNTVLGRNSHFPCVSVYHIDALLSGPAIINLRNKYTMPGFIDYDNHVRAFSSSIPVSQRYVPHSSDFYTYQYIVIKEILSYPHICIEDILTDIGSYIPEDRYNNSEVHPITFCYLTSIYRKLLLTRHNGITDDVSDNKSWISTSRPYCARLPRLASTRHHFTCALPRCLIPISQLSMLYSDTSSLLSHNFATCNGCSYPGSDHAHDLQLIQTTIFKEFIHPSYGDYMSDVIFNNPSIDRLLQHDNILTSTSSSMTSNSSSISTTRRHNNTSESINYNDSDDDLEIIRTQSRYGLLSSSQHDNYNKDDLPCRECILLSIPCMPYRHTLLHYACYHGNVELVECILKHLDCHRHVNLIDIHSKQPYTINHDSTFGFNDTDNDTNNILSESDEDVLINCSDNNDEDSDNGHTIKITNNLKRHKSRIKYKILRSRRLTSGDSSDDDDDELSCTDKYSHSICIMCNHIDHIINAEDDNGTTPLHYAIVGFIHRKAQEKIISIYNKKDNIINSKGDSYISRLHNKMTSSTSYNRDVYTSKYDFIQQLGIMNGHDEYIDYINQNVNKINDKLSLSLSSSLPLHVTDDTILAPYYTIIEQLLLHGANVDHHPKASPEAWRPHDVFSAINTHQTVPVASNNATANTTTQQVVAAPLVATAAVSNINRRRMSVALQAQPHNNNNNIQHTNVTLRVGGINNTAAAPPANQHGGHINLNKRPLYATLPRQSSLSYVKPVPHLVQPAPDRAITPLCQRRMSMQTKFDSLLSSHDGLQGEGLESPPFKLNHLNKAQLSCSSMVNHTIINAPSSYVRGLSSISSALASSSSSLSSSRTTVRNTSLFNGGKYDGISPRMLLLHAGQEATDILNLVFKYDSLLGYNIDQNGDTRMNLKTDIRPFDAELGSKSDNADLIKYRCAIPGYISTPDHLIISLHQAVLCQDAMTLVSLLRNIHVSISKCITNEYNGDYDDLQVLWGDINNIIASLPSIPLQVILTISLSLLSIIGQQCHTRDVWDVWWLYTYEHILSNDSRCIHLAYQCNVPLYDIHQPILLNDGDMNKYDQLTPIESIYNQHRQISPLSQLLASHLLSQQILVAAESTNYDMTFHLLHHNSYLSSIIDDRRNPMLLLHNTHLQLNRTDYDTGRTPLVLLTQHKSLYNHYYYDHHTLELDIYNSKLPSQLSSSYSTTTTTTTATTTTTTSSYNNDDDDDDKPSSIGINDMGSFLNRIMMDIIQYKPCHDDWLNIQQESDLDYIDSDSCIYGVELDTINMKDDSLYSCPGWCHLLPLLIMPSLHSILEYRYYHHEGSSFYGSNDIDSIISTYNNNDMLRNLLGQGWYIESDASSSSQQASQATTSLINTLISIPLRPSSTQRPSKRRKLTQSPLNNDHNSIALSNHDVRTYSQVYDIRGMRFLDYLLSTPTLYHSIVKYNKQNKSYPVSTRSCIDCIQLPCDKASSTSYYSYNAMTSILYSNPWKDSIDGTNDDDDYNAPNGTNTNANAASSIISSFLYRHLTNNSQNSAANTPSLPVVTVASSSPPLVSLHSTSVSSNNASTTTSVPPSTNTASTITSAPPSANTAVATSTRQPTQLYVPRGTIVTGTSQIRNTARRAILNRRSAAQHSTSLGSYSFTQSSLDKCLNALHTTSNSSWNMTAGTTPYTRSRQCLVGTSTVVPTSTQNNLKQGVYCLGENIYSLLSCGAQRLTEYSSEWLDATKLALYEQYILHQRKSRQGRDMQQHIHSVPDEHIVFGTFDNPNHNDLLSPSSPSSSLPFILDDVSLGPSNDTPIPSAPMSPEPWYNTTPNSYLTTKTCPLCDYDIDIGLWGGLEETYVTPTPPTQLGLDSTSDDDDDSNKSSDADSIDSDDMNIFNTQRPSVKPVYISIREQRHQRHIMAVTLLIDHGIGWL